MICPLKTFTKAYNSDLISDLLASQRSSLSYLLCVTTWWSHSASYWNKSSSYWLTVQSLTWWRSTDEMSYCYSLIRGEPERAPNTREMGSGFYMYMYIGMFSLWGDHFSEERIQFEPHVGNGRHAHTITIHWQHKCCTQSEWQLETCTV